MKVGELLTAYADLRDDLRKARKEFKKFEEATKDRLLSMELEILDKQRTLGVTSLSTKNLTAFQSDKRTIRISDWDKFAEWILKTGNIACIQKRPAKLSLVELIDDNSVNPSDIGILDETEIEVKIRKR